MATSTQDGKSSQAIAPSGAKPSSRPPATESYIAREKERIALLLELNGELLWDLKTRRESGEAGSLSELADQSETQQANIKLENPPSPEYIEVHRRLQANFSYLIANHEATLKPNVISFDGPAIMTPPTEDPKYVEYYSKLRDLFPGWHGVKFSSRESSMNDGQAELKNSAPPRTN